MLTKLLDNRLILPPFSPLIYVEDEDDAFSLTWKRMISWLQFLAVPPVISVALRYWDCVLVADTYVVSTHPGVDCFTRDHLIIASFTSVLGGES